MTPQGKQEFEESGLQPEKAEIEALQQETESPASEAEATNASDTGPEQTL